jgi:hypothetical protein
MRRKTFDTLLTTGGLVVAIMLLVAGSLLAWGHTFVAGQVHDQLTAQKIFFPAAGSAALPAAQYPNLQQYGGQQLTTGDQAAAYADDFIGAHLAKIGGGQTYSQLSAKAQAAPTDTALKATVDTMFRGETLRGLLLNAYAFGTMGQIALYAAIASFLGAAVMLLLTLLGWMHLRRTDPDAVLGAPNSTRDTRVAV